MPVLFLEQGYGDMMDSDLRTRTIIALAWLTEDAKHRFDEAKDPMHTGASGGYSPELTDAMKVLEELREPELPTANGAVQATYISEEQCKDIAVMAGGLEADGEAFYLQYAPQGFRYGNGQPIVDLRIAIRRWLVRGAERDDAPAPRMGCTGPTPRELDMQARGENA